MTGDGAPRQIVVLRPAAAAARTAAHLLARGFAPLVAPLTTIAASPPPRLIAADPGGSVVTSAAALKAVTGHPDLAALKALPIWTVGTETAAAARRHGFADVRAAGGDAVALAARLREEAPRGPALLWLAGADVAADLRTTAAADGIRVERYEVYRSVAVDELSPALATALRAGSIEAVLHYSARSARLYIALTTAAGLIEWALRPRQLCLSARIAASFAAAEASPVSVAARPDEVALFDLLGSPSPAQAVR